MDTCKWMVVTLLALAGCGGAPLPATTIPLRVPTTFAEQVSIGGVLFGQHCASCHGDDGRGTGRGPRLVGLDDGVLPLNPPADRLLRHIQFRTIADVDDFAVRDMPKNAPGSLGRDQYWAILAFDLHANGIDLLPPLDDEEATTLTIPRP